MTTAATVAKPRAFFGTDNTPSATFSGHAIEMQSDGTGIIKDVPVFKAGTFRDSWGDQHTWTAEHLQQMCDNFDLLKARLIFPDVPVRQDHTSSIERVIGYFESVRTDGSFLYADLHVTEPTALDKLARGTYRSRSLEVGMFVANDESAYWPTVFGVAYVDIPAVEGLHGKPNSKTSYFSMAPTEGDSPMSGTPTPTDLAPAKPNADHNHSITPPAPAPVATPPAPAATFRINGGEVNDFAKVQAHIDTLEQFAKDTQDAGRKDFVNGLSRDKKIVATQVEAMTKFALGLSAEQYAEWAKTYEGAPATPLLAKHGATGDGSIPAGETDPAEDRKSILQETIAMHRRSGMSEDKIKTTSAFTELATLNANKS